MKKFSVGDIFLIGAVVILSIVIIIDKFKDNREQVKQTQQQIKENNSQIENLEEKGKQEEQTREELEQEIEALEELKKQPHGKKNYADNVSVIRAERYFARRYRQDSIKDR